MQHASADEGGLLDAMRTFIRAMLKMIAPRPSKRRRNMYQLSKVVQQNVAQHVDAASTIVKILLHLIHLGVCPQAFAYYEPALQAQEDSNVPVGRRS